MGEDIKVLIVDDTVTYRVILTGVIKKIPEARFVGHAQNGRIALRKIKDLDPDLVLLDIEMPDLDGFEVLKEIRKFNDTVDVVIVSGQNRENVQRTLETLHQGALDFIEKPMTRDRAESENMLINSLKPIIQMVQIRKNSRTSRGVVPCGELQKERAQRPPMPEQTLARVIRVTPKKVDFVLIGISTGGPNALQRLIPKLSRKMSCPILIVQHMPAKFTAELADRLNTLTDLNVREAKEGDVPKAGEVLIAPGGIHMILRKEDGIFRVRLIDSEPVNSCKPAVDVLFDSLARYCGDTVVTIVMTGMGRDGSAGVKALREKGAYSLIQSEETCTIWGMPAAVKENGDYDEEVPLDELGDRLSQIVLKARFFEDL